MQAGAALSRCFSMRFSLGFGSRRTDPPTPALAGRGRFSPTAWLPGPSVADGDVRGVLAACFSICRLSAPAAVQEQ
jgi:hypothetical protein